MPKLKISSLRRDEEIDKNGKWEISLEIPGVEFKVSPIHVEPYRAALEAQTAYDRKRWPKSIPESVALASIGKILAEHILHDWRGFDIDYSPETAAEVLANPDYCIIAASVRECAIRASAPQLQFVDDPKQDVGKDD